MPRILIVDDEEVVRKSLERWFLTRGFDVQTAADGQEAVERCAASAYDAVTMDLDMPRMDGVTAIKLIRRDHPALPIVVLTGLPQPALRAGRDGISAVLTKPTRPSDVEKEVLRAIA